MRLCQGFAFYLVDIKYLRADKLTILVPNKLSVFIAISLEKLVLNKFRSVAKEFQILSQSVKWEAWNVQTGWFWIFQMKDLLPFKYLNFLSIAVNSSKTNFYVINRKKTKDTHAVSMQFKSNEVFRTHSKVKYGAFCENNWLRKTFNYYR